MKLVMISHQCSQTPSPCHLVKQGPSGSPETVQTDAVAEHRGHEWVLGYRSQAQSHSEIWGQLLC